MRFDEDYKSFKDSISLSWYERVKFSRLNETGNSYFSLGGEVRYQYFKFKNEDWGDSPEDDDGFILNRLLLHGDLHVTNKIRVFAQLQSSLAGGRMGPVSPVEQNELDVHQLFVDLSIVENESNSLVLRGGRHELSYGSSRLISVREGPNNRHSFDGVKAIFSSRNVKTDIFFSKYVINRIGIFNDKVLDNSIRFGGVYTVWNAIPVIKNIDVYYLVIKRRLATWNDVQGDELRHSVGTRVWGKSMLLQYDFEGVIQFGKIGGSDISAWTLSANTTWNIKPGELSPSVGLKTELISGDKKLDDGHVESFNPLFPRGAYFGYAALIGPSNLFDIHPSITIPITRKVSFYADYDIFWRYSTNDGIYHPGAFMIYPAEDSAEKFIGDQLGGVIEFNPNKYIHLKVEMTWFKPAAYLKSVSAGKDILFTGVTTTFKF